MTYPSYYNWGQGITPVQQTPIAQQPPSQPQNGGLIVVPGEDDVVNYPVAPGYTMTFVDSNFTHLYAKTASTTQFDPPRYKKYALTEEEMGVSQPKQSKENADYVTKSELDKVWSELKKLRNKGGEGK